MNTLCQPLEFVDEEIYELINREKERQINGLELIASENFTSLAVLECLSSVLTNKYSEGLPGSRYYGGNEVIDEIESLAQKRALEAFHLNPDVWGVNVQPLSGSPANFAIYTGLVQPHGRIMGLDLADGGHLTHGFFTAKKKISATSMFFESMPYKVNPLTGLIDYDELEKNAGLFKPALIIAGITCYSRNLDYARFRKICDQNGSYLMGDMSHISGLVAANVIPGPFEHCDVVSTTTHKTLRGPRAAVIFYRKNLVNDDLENKINNAVFPGLQGGPHNNAIAGIAVAMKLASTLEFKEYQKQVLSNAKTLCHELQSLGYEIVTGGTDNHIILMNLSSIKLSGTKAEAILEKINISVNKNTVPGDKSAMNPSGIRIGTPPLTSRGCKDTHMKIVANFIHSGLQLALMVQKISGPKLIGWKLEVERNHSVQESIISLRREIQSFSKELKMPGLIES